VNKHQNNTLSIPALYQQKRNICRNVPHLISVGLHKYLAKTKRRRAAAGGASSKA
jgi:hypothetical protein